MEWKNNVPTFIKSLLSKLEDSEINNSDRYTDWMKVYAVVPVLTIDGYWVWMEHVEVRSIKQPFYPQALSEMTLTYNQYRRIPK